MSKLNYKNKLLFFSKFWLLCYGNYIVFFIFFYKPSLRSRKRRFRFFRSLRFLEKKKTKKTKLLSKLFLKLKRKRRNRLIRRFRYKVKKRLHKLRFSMFFKNSIANKFKFRSRKNVIRKRRFLKSLGRGLWNKKHYKFLKYRLPKKHAIRRSLKYLNFKRSPKLFNKILPLRELYNTKTIYSLFKLKLRRYRSKKRLRIRHVFKNNVYSRL